ncbi:uncharacterized protein LOC106166786 [Lingula anatina]|uniref:Uncharacterized protein LOC106166786 n=1 Tax=Lingula anatina TaxID=7574 RepID=A0A1S3ISI6_LINAN|nr:uncharacterized protein LOC106166786 [Lingula anatina]|eukprot:XP_013400901.1 uncharacterized protein LOC106166786 [Lingula anatina]
MNMSRFNIITAVAAFVVLSATTCATGMGGICPNFEVLPGYGEVCVSRSMAESWDQAVYRCAKMCGRLFMPKNPTDDHVLGTILNREASTIKLSYNKRVWLGAYSKNGSAPVWSDSTLMERPTLAFTSSRLGCSALTAYVEPYRRTEDFVAGNYSCIGPETGHNFVCMRSSSYSVPKGGRNWVSLHQSVIGK